MNPVLGFVIVVLLLAFEGVGFYVLVCRVGGIEPFGTPRAWGVKEPERSKRRKQSRRPDIHERAAPELWAKAAGSPGLAALMEEIERGRERNGQPPTRPS